MYPWIWYQISLKLNFSLLFHNRFSLSLEKTFTSVRSTFKAPSNLKDAVIDETTWLKETFGRNSDIENEVQPLNFNEPDQPI